MPRGLGLGYIPYLRSRVGPHSMSRAPCLGSRPSLVPKSNGIALDPLGTECGPALDMESWHGMWPNSHPPSC